MKAFPHVGNYAVDLAQIMISNDKADDAVEYLTNYLDENNNQPVAHLELAELLIQRNLYDQASIHLRKAFESEEISLQDKLNNFVPLVKQLNDREALIKELGKILVEVHAQNSNAYAANGDLYFSLDQRIVLCFSTEKLLSLMPQICNCGKTFSTLN